MFFTGSCSWNADRQARAIGLHRLTQTMLRDVFFFGFLGSSGLLALKRPFIFVLLFIYVDILIPQALGYGLISQIPLSLIAFGAALVGWLFFDSGHRAGLSLQHSLILLLLLYCGATTLAADFPAEAAAKWAWVWKVLVFACFLPLTLSSRLRIEAAIATILLAGSAIIVSGGIKTLLSGGGYGALRLLMVSNNGLYESSTLSCFAIAIIPLILFITRKASVIKTSCWTRLYGLALCFACLLIPIGTEARTGLVCIAVLAFCLLRFVRYRALYLVTVAGLIALSPALLPESFIARMTTIETAQGDSSASVRLGVWRWTLDYASHHPFGGGFDAYRGNKLRLELKQEADLSADASASSPQDARSVVAEDRSRAYHSAYFEMLGEQGWPGLFLWLALHGLGLVQMERLYRRFRKSSTPDQSWISSLALALQQAHLVYLAGAAFIGIAFLPFGFLLIALETGLARLAKQQMGARRQGFFPVVPGQAA